MSGVFVPAVHYLAKNSKELEEWVKHHHFDLGNDIEIATGKDGECIGYIDAGTKEEISIIMK